MANKSIAIVGLWHLGCVYATSFAELGFNVIGFDTDKNVVNNLNKGVPPIFEPELEETLKKHLNKNLTFSSTEKVMKNKDYIFVTYDVPVDNNDIVQMGVIKELFKKLVNNISAKTIIVISSQIPVGTSRSLVDALKKKGMSNPKVIYFPENLRLGQAFSSFLQPDRIILGSDNDNALNQFKKDFSFGCTTITMGLESAEMVKHALNSYLALCISFSSELSDIGEKVGANMLDVVKALKTDKRVSPFAPLNPGLGFAGGTLGRDVQSLKKISRDKKYNTKILNAVYEVNHDRLPMLIKKIKYVYPVLNTKNVGILGLTYKPKTNTLRRSMSLELATLLKKNGCKLKAFDPVIHKKIDSFTFITVSGNLEEFFRDLDLVVLMTDWQEFLDLDIKKLSKLMKNKVIIDSKNFLDSSKYKQLGFTYLGIGIN